MNKNNQKQRERKALLSIYESANLLLSNIYDAGEHENPETGEIYPDINELEKALALLNKTFKLGKE